LGVLEKDPLAAPIAEISGRSGVDVVLFVVPGPTSTEDKPDQVMGIGGVVALLPFGADLVVRLGDDLGWRDARRVITKGTKGRDVSHGRIAF
jgi:hypothetical protein